MFCDIIAGLEFVCFVLWRLSAKCEISKKTKTIMAATLILLVLTQNIFEGLSLNCGFSGTCECTANADCTLECTFVYLFTADDLGDHYVYIK